MPSAVSVHRRIFLWFTCVCVCVFKCSNSVPYDRLEEHLADHSKHNPVHRCAFDHDTSVELIFIGTS